MCIVEGKWKCDRDFHLATEFVLDVEKADPEMLWAIVQLIPGNKCQKTSVEKPLVDQWNVYKKSSQVDDEMYLGHKPTCAEALKWGHNLLSSIKKRTETHCPVEELLGPWAEVVGYQLMVRKDLTLSVEIRKVES